jgi:hypothetical protein
MKEIEGFISFMTICNSLEQYQQFLVAIQWLLLYKILKTNIKPANHMYHTALHYTVTFIWYKKAILLMPAIYTFITFVFLQLSCNDLDQSQIYTLTKHCNLN